MCIDTKLNFGSAKRNFMKTYKKTKNKAHHFIKALSKIKRNYLIIGSVFIFSLLIISFLIVSMMFKAGNSLIHKAAEHAKTIQIDQTPLTKIQTINCWEHAKTLLAITPWLEQPTDQIILNLKKTCLQEPQSKCETENCNSKDSFI